MGTIGDAHTHISSCTYQLVPCTKECGEEIRRGTLETHLTEICPKRIVKCQYCKRKGAHKLISKSHLDECPDLPITCGECNQTMPQRLYNETCPKAMTSCVASMKKHLDRAMKKIDASSNQNVFMLPGYELISKSHLDECPDLPITCGECNQTMPQRLHNETCPKAMTSCVASMKKHLDRAMKKIDASSNQNVFMLVVCMS